MSSTPDEQELRELNLPPVVIDSVREASALVAETSAQGGLRARHKAAAMAERLAMEIIDEVPRGYAGAVPPEDPPTLKNGGTLAEAALRRARGEDTEAHVEDQDDRERLRKAVREAQAQRARQ